MLLTKDPILGSKGTSEDGEEVFFFQESALELKNDLVSVPDSGIILKAGVLKAKGCICIRKPVSQRLWGMVIEEQDFYKVMMSNIESIEVGSMVVVKEFSPYKFNLTEDKQASFIFPGTILLVAHKDRGILPGPDYLMLKTDTDLEDKDLAEKIHQGYDEEYTYYFDRHSHRVKIKGQLYIFVKKKDVKLIGKKKERSVLAWS